MYIYFWKYYNILVCLTVRNENSYNYGPDGSYEQAKFKSAFNLDQCSEEIKNMVKQHLLPLDYIEVMEEIGRGMSINHDIVISVYAYTTT